MDRRTLLLGAAALLPAAPRASETWPTRPVRLISVYAAGGGPDVQLRQAAPVIGELLGQSMVIENRVGAAGAIATQYAATQPPDGYTFVMGSNTQLIQKILKPDLRFDVFADFAPVSNMNAAPTVLVVRADAPWRTLHELAAAGKAMPAGMNYGSGGIGTSAHLAGATFASLNGLKVTHIPLKGSVEIAASLLRGDTHYAFPVAGTGVPQVKGGKLRALAVSSRQRLAQLPDVPTWHEITGNDLTVQESWFGLWAPARTPPEIVSKMHAAVVKALRTPAVEQAYEASGTRPVPSESPQAFTAFMHDEQRKWAEIIRVTGVTAG